VSKTLAKGDSLMYCSTAVLQYFCNTSAVMANAVPEGTPRKNIDEPGDI
jgi:hypothetical protein